MLSIRTMLSCQELSNREDAQHESRLLVTQVPRLWLGAFEDRVLDVFNARVPWF
jgi:hypothetical protein